MEKSSAIFLSEAEKKMIRRGTYTTCGGIIKTAGMPKPKGEVPERFKGWYSHDELKGLL